MSNITSRQAPPFPSRRSASPLRQHRSRRRRIEPRSLIVLLCSVVLITGSGCTTTRTIDSPGEPGELHPGDAVKVSLRDGRELELRFVEWTVDHFVGRDQTDALRMIERRHISHLEIARVSAIRTGLLVATIAGVVLAVVAAYVKENLAPPFAPGAGSATGPGR